MQYGVTAISVACQSYASRGSSAGIDPSLAETLRNAGIDNNEKKVNKATVEETGKYY